MVLGDAGTAALNAGAAVVDEAGTDVVAGALVVLEAGMLVVGGEGPDAATALNEKGAS